MIEAADLLGSERLLCSNPTTAGALVRTETVREANDAVLAAMKHVPGRIGGYYFVQPGNGAAALDEIERYLEAGMIGVKLCNQVKLDDPAVFPVAEKCIQRRVRFRGHSGHGTGARMQRTQQRRRSRWLGGHCHHQQLHAKAAYALPVALCEHSRVAGLQGSGSLQVLFCQGMLAQSIPGSGAPHPAQ